MSHRYLCRHCHSIVTTPEPYDGKHWVGLPGLGFVGLPCSGTLEPITEEQETTLLAGGPDAKALLGDGRIKQRQHIAPIKPRRSEP